MDGTRRGSIGPALARLRALPALPMDAAFALAVALVATLLDAFDPDHHAPVPNVWTLLLAAPLVLRRRTPALAAALVGLVCLAQWIAGTQAYGDVVVLLMLYTLAVQERRRWVQVSAVLVAELGIGMAVTRWAPPVHAVLIALTATGTVAASWLLGMYVRTHRAYVASVVARAEAAERDRDTRARVAVEAERARIAREMHDIIAHSLSVIITLNDAAATVRDPAAARRATSQASEVGREALSQMQRLLGVLRSPDPAERAPQPGLTQLPELVDMVRRAGLPIELSTAGALSRLDAGAELVLYRVVQECLTNILKHAGNVTRVELRVAADDDGRVEVDIVNDGDRVSAGAATGHGLVGMRERVALFDGRLDAAPRPGGGWRVRASFDGGVRSRAGSAVPAAVPAVVTVAP